MTHSTNSIYKKIILLFLVLGTLLHAKTPAPKMGCILSQEGKVTFDWSIYGDKRHALQGSNQNVNYNAIAKEGHMFKDILIGSTMTTTFQGKNLVAKFMLIKSKKRIKRGPRHGVIVLNITLNDISKDISTVYFYESGDMMMKDVINLKDFKMADKNKYVEFAFGLHVYSVVCAIE